MLASLVRYKTRPHAMRFDNHFSRGYLNRASWLRQDVEYLTNACKSDKSKFVILDAACNPLVRREDGSSGVKDVIKNKIEGAFKA